MPNFNWRIEDGYYIGTTATKVVIKYWRPHDSNTIKYCITAKFDEYNTISTDGKLSPGSKVSKGELKSEKNQGDFKSINYQKHLLLERNIEQIEIELPQKEVQL